MMGSSGAHKPWLDPSVPRPDTGCLTNVPGDVPPEDVLWVTAPSDDESISIWIFIASPTPAEQAFLVDATPLGGFSLTSGEAVVVMAASTH
jgi:hypothetical protein